MAEHTKYQQKIIKNYYQNYDALAMQRLGEQVSELYLAEGKARGKMWQQVTKSLEKLKVPASRIKHVVSSDDPALLAKLLEELLAKT
jgi:heme oxygenase